MTYVESSSLMNDVEFRGRIKVACLRYATYIYNEPVSTPGHGARLRWAQGAMENPEGASARIQPPVVMDPAVQAEGPAISDEVLQTAVENTINTLL